MSAPTATEVFVTVLADDGPTHTREQIAAMVGASASPAPAQSPARSTDATVAFPTAKFDLLCEVEPRVRRTFDHTRKDKTAQAWSNSEWDMSLAGFAVNAGWSDAEIGSLIREHRKKHGDPAKGERDDYIARTIERARGGESPEPKVTVTRTDDDGNEADAQVDALDHARSRTRLPTLQRVIQHGATEPIFSLDLGDRRLNVGPTAKLRDPNHMGDLIAIENREWPWMPKRGTAWFLPTANALLAIAEIEDTDSSPDDITHQWVASFQGRNEGEPMELDDPAQRAKAAEGGPLGISVFRAEDMLHLHAPSLDNYVRTVLKIPGITERNITTRLAAIGFKSVTVEAPRDKAGRKVKRRYWRSQPGYHASEHA